MHIYKKILFGRLLAKGKLLSELCLLTSTYDQGVVLAVNSVQEATSRIIG